MAMKIRQVNSRAGNQIFIKTDNLIRPLVKTLADHVMQRVPFVLDKVRWRVEEGRREIDDERRGDNAHLDRKQLIIEIAQHRNRKPADFFNFKFLKADVRISLRTV